MALPEFALSELLDAFGAGEGVDLICDAVGLVRRSWSSSRRPSGSALPVTSVPRPG
jgi:hypothetical protein